MAEKGGGGAYPKDTGAGALCIWATEKITWKRQGSWDILIA